MVGAAILIRTHSDSPGQPIPNNVFQRPPEATLSVLIHSLKHQQHAANLENRRANERGHPPADQKFIMELRPRLHIRKPRKERIDDPNAGAEREYSGHQP